MFYLQNVTFLFVCSLLEMFLLLFLWCYLFIAYSSMHTFTTRTIFFTLVIRIYVTFFLCLFCPFLFTLFCVCVVGESKKCQNETVFQEWEKGDRFSKDSQIQKSKTCCNIQFSFQGLIKIHSSTMLKAHATHENPHCDGRRRNLFLNNCNIITIIRGKNNSDINNWGSYRAWVTCEGAGGFGVLSVIYQTRRYV